MRTRCPASTTFVSATSTPVTWLATAAIFIRGLLQHEYGVDLRKVHWVQGAMNTGGAHGSPAVLPLLKPFPIEQNHSNKSMSDLLEERVVDALVGTGATPGTRDVFRKKLRTGELDTKEIEIQVADTGGSMPSLMFASAVAPVLVAPMFHTFG